MRKSLHEKILERQNIYNAIFSLESYIFEPNLLSEDDFKEFRKLSDKFDWVEIEKVIGKCQNRLETILSNSDELFEISVYFKLKKYDTDKQTLRFRPLHTAPLIDQICMVCMLMPLMFEDGESGRKRSQLTQLIPSNFYGNIPSCRLDRLFERWQTKYSQYTANVMSNRRQFHDNHKYGSEVSLDIKNFFPSIDPRIIYRYITESYHVNDEDKSTLDTVLKKLLYFTIRKDGFDGWEETYYGEKLNLAVINRHMNCGIPQGLPQSYFFGNLCMIYIERLLRREDTFNGPAFFYVDDSVIYIRQRLDEKEFLSRLKNVNRGLKELQVILDQGESPYRYNNLNLPVWISEFQSSIKYGIEFHTTDKSSYCPIEKAMDGLGGLECFNKETSMSKNVLHNLEDVEDKVSLDKLKAIIKVVEYEISSVKENIANESAKPDKEIRGNLETRLKVLKRYSRYFKFRIEVLESRTSNYTNSNPIENIVQLFNLDCDLPSLNLENWVEKLSDDIFMSRVRIAMSESSKDVSNDLFGKIQGLEIGVCSNRCKMPSTNLYYSKVLNPKYLDFNSQPYESLKAILQSNGLIKGSQDIDKRKEQFEEFCKNTVGKIHSFISEYSLFAFNHSDEYKRRVFNAIFSAISDITIDDQRIFVKQNGRQLSYFELRILAMLRNQNFNKAQFDTLMKNFERLELPDRMAIDMSVLGILNIFIRYVCTPEKIDNLIRIHRIVKGLWLNGSKFLNEYTLHNEEHAVTLIRHAVHLVNTIDYFSLKSYDYYLLFSACYLHDISMVIHPRIFDFNKNEYGENEVVTRYRNTILADPERYYYKPHSLPKISNDMVRAFVAVFDHIEDTVRKRHHIESAKYIRQSSGTPLTFISPADLDIIADVAESHGIDKEEIYWVKSKARDSHISSKYQKILLRLADLLDVANDRVNYYLLRQNLSHLSEISRFHWISHLVTDEIVVRASYRADTKNKVILETLEFDLKLNIKASVHFENKNKCQGCDLVSHSVSANSSIITINILDDEHAKCSNEYCPLVCKWMMKKHFWLINELCALKEYLSMVNIPLIRTALQINIIGHEDFELDDDLYSTVRRNLEH